MTKLYFVIRYYNSFNASAKIVSVHTDKGIAEKSAESFRVTIPKRSRHLVIVQTEVVRQKVSIEGDTNEDVGESTL